MYTMPVFIALWLGWAALLFFVLRRPLLALASARATLTQLIAGGIGLALGYLLAAASVALMFQQF